MINTDVTDILIVDDLPDKLLVYKTVLEELGQNLITASSGEDALRQVLQRDFSVILLDVNMPTMDGFETARLIRQRRRSALTPIIFLTSYVDEIRTAEAYSHGAVDFMLAPVVPDVLRAKVRVFVDLFRMTRQVMRQAEERVALTEERTKRLAAEEANRNLTFLAKCRAQLGNSLEIDTTTRDLAMLAVPFLADWSLVAMPKLERGDWLVTTARSEGDGPPTTITGHFPDYVPASVKELTVRVFDRGQHELFQDPVTATDGHTLALPLTARNRTLGVVVFHRGAGRGGFEDTVQNLADSLVSRAAVALDNAQLFMTLKEADRQRTEFLSMLAHELRNPLAPIRNAVEVLRDGRLAQQDLAISRDIIGRQVQHLVRLVDDLLDISRITQGKIRLQMSPVNVQKVVGQAIEASQPEIDARGHRLNLSMPSESLNVYGDATRIAQILTNLLNNAAKYTKDGGEITLAVRRDNDLVVFQIRDNGIGIPPEMINKVFDLFTQVDRTLDRAQGGLGIGLTLVRRLVEMHNGKVEVSSAGEGHGSEFAVLLPLYVPAVMESSSESWSQDGPNYSTNACRVLVVDDNRDSADSLAMLLQLAGYRTRIAYDGHSALDAIAAELPDVVLLDIGLPGIDGYEVARRLRENEQTKSLLLIAITGYGKEENRDLAMTAGFDLHFVKPVEVKELMDALESRSLEPANVLTDGD
jgi:signal transduction histidine kinase/DNA-binding response OmpR family regulator